MGEPLEVGSEWLDASTEISDFRFERSKRFCSLAPVPTGTPSLYHTIYALENFFAPGPNVFHALDRS